MRHARVKDRIARASGRVQTRNEWANEKNEKGRALARGMPMLCGPKTDVTLAIINTLR
jgi:hypothetical protein